MRGGDQLFRVGALLVLETGLERIGGVGEDAGIGAQPSLAVLAGAAPDGLCLAVHVRSSLMSSCLMDAAHQIARPRRVPAARSLSPATPGRRTCWVILTLFSIIN